MKNSAVTVIIVAALLLELTAAGMYYTSQHIIQNTMERLVKTEMNALYLCIRNKLAAVEVAVDNMAWMVNENIDNPDDMFDLTSRLVENNPSILGSSISFVPDYYSKKGHWFEPYAARRIDGSVESMQMACRQVEHSDKERNEHVLFVILCQGFVDSAHDMCRMGLMRRCRTEKRMCHRHQHSRRCTFTAYIADTEEHFLVPHVVVVQITAHLSCRFKIASQLHPFGLQIQMWKHRLLDLACHTQLGIYTGFLFVHSA